MRIRGVAVLLWAALALGAAACSGDDEEPGAATTATAAGPATTQPPATGTTEAPPAATTEPEAEAEEEAAPGGAALIAEAASKTAAVGSARVGTTVRITDPGLGQVRFSGRGAFDFERREGELALRLVEGDDGGFGRTSQAVFQDTAAYYQLPPGALPGGKRWIRLELQDVADASSLGLGPLVQGSQADPSQHLLWLTALDPAVSRIAEEEVRGAHTTRYRAAVDLGRLERQAPPGKEAEWDAYVRTLRDGLGLEFIPVEVWVDDDGLVRRLQHELALADGRTAAVTTELSGFGMDVSAKAPPPGQVAALSDLIRP